ncbi:MAG TPA: hypothetical protein VHB47_24765 [Thermoanaerobaculia bacterium]|jgi:hypothetical protein|nr:hypothetical protein [Thermoanaerobaculia bacterium]
MISVTLPSLYPEVLVTCLDNMRWTARGRLEILVVSPFQPPVGAWGGGGRGGGEVIWVREMQRLGIAAAHAQAAAKATGDYLFPWADDHLMMDGWDETSIAEHEEGRKHSIFSLGLRHVAPHDNVETIFGMYYGCFPLMLRRDVEKVGGWLHEGFRAGFSDADLGLRVWENAGRCEWSTARVVRPTQSNVRPGQWEPKAHEDALREDLRLLCRRHDWIARDWPTHDASLVNIGVNPERTRLVVDLNTIFCTHAEKFHRAHPVPDLQPL